MRMWMLPPIYMCTYHVNGEHGEIHKHMPGLARGIRIDGRMSPVVQIQLNAIQSRHACLAAEIDRRAAIRGYGGHLSPLTNLPNLAAIYPAYFHYQVDPAAARLDLMTRCPECRHRLQHGIPWPSSQ